MLNRYYTTQEVSELRLADNKIFGAPAASVNKHTENLNNSRGYYGEAIIGNILNLIAVETPGAYICHSVGFIDNTKGETDHVLIYKNRVMLIETKAYSTYTSYRVNKEGVLTANKNRGRFHRINDSNVFDKVAYYQEMFPNRKVQAILAIVRDDVKTWSENGRYKVTSLTGFMSLIREEMAAADEVKEPTWGVVKQFALLCLKPKAAENMKLPVTGPVEVPSYPEHTSVKSRYTQRPAVLRH